MTEETLETSASAECIAGYLGRVLERRAVWVEPGDEDAAGSRGAGHIGPTIWADAPWRLEPDQSEIPFTFLIRDAEDPQTAMELDEIVVCEAPADGQPWDKKDWQVVHRFTAGLGAVTRRTWTYRVPPATPRDLPPIVPLTQFTTAAPGQNLCLKIVFRGRRQEDQESLEFETWKHLRIHLAGESLPLRDSPQWYYGDTHYHSDYTNDLKEFGGPIPDTRAAAERIGLDWLVITDHSCDLIDENPYWEETLADSRWADLGLEVQAHSDDRFRLLRGEEVTVLGQPGRGSDTLHLLVFGAGLEKFIPGAWAKKSLLTTVASHLLGFASELYAHLFGPIHSLGSVLTGVDRSGQTVKPLEGRSVQAQDAVAFAAHPTAIAQGPGGTWEMVDLMQPIHGMEAWNGGLRRHTRREDSPFDHWQDDKPWDETVSKSGIDAWDEILRSKIERDDPRHVLLAGSDAHGSFNYTEGWWVDWDGLRVDDNALGKARTLIYLPHRDPGGSRLAPSEAEVMEACRIGSCIATDGPALNFTVSHDGTQCGLGGILEVRGGGELEVSIQAASTAEFGPVEQVLVSYYLRGMERTASMPIDFDVGRSLVLDGELSDGPGFIRLAAVTHNGSDTYRCFTIPSGSSHRRLVDANSVSPALTGEFGCALCSGSGPEHRDRARRGGAVQDRRDGDELQPWM